MQAALIQLPDSFLYEDLFTKIVQLSYEGDVRMNLGEDQKKIQKIVKGSMERLKSIYSPLLSDDQRIHIGGEKLQQDTSTPAIYHRLNLLPFAVVDGLSEHYKKSDPKQRDIEEVLFSMAHRHDVSFQVANNIRAIVANSSRNQTFKNFFTAGFTKSALYAMQKIGKRFLKH